MKKKLNCVLLIDDDDSTNFINKMVIERARIAERVEVALNGKEAIDFLTNNGKHKKEAGYPFPQPMLILLDINMPVMDGWEFLEAYSKLPAHQKSEIIIVMLTTSLNPDDSQRAKGIREISGFKSKPLTFETLNDILNNHFPEHL